MGTPPQTPRFFLPQAEYLSTAPNATIALQGRRRYTLTIIAPGTSIPAATIQQFNANLQLEAPFPHGAGIFVHDVWIVTISGDSSGEIQVTGMALGLGSGAPQPVPAYEFGLPALTTLSPIGVTVALRDQEKLVTSDDVRLLSLSFLNAAGPNLFLVASLTVHNVDATNAHTFQANAQIIYTRLDGITE